ncbi:polymer-forming cytoskeletal protein [candidate division Kazan bacterium]|uniref:Polymer-forming cytoskeletal protein n=1 Tax=candidate division Kazan bacterium TaxID=2202143 RepID=A0A420ZD75_UNCK3|nr:MAG: polymer-forming cytoskeletal protein [candidate division Kazan bacterium]
MKTRGEFAESDNPDTIIGYGVSVEGTLQTAGDIQINGYFKGKLITRGDVVIGEHGQVDANINAENVYIAGEVTGNVNAIDKLEILETGKVDGNISSTALVIESGGVLKGSSTMRDTEDTKPAVDPTYEVEEAKKASEEEAVKV